jgi:hypothetical protein
MVRGNPKVPKEGTFAFVGDMRGMPREADPDEANAVGHAGNKAPAGKIRMADEILSEAHREIDKQLNRGV